MSDEIGARIAEAVATYIKELEAEIERLRDQVTALTAGAPVVRCCEHCELCEAEREMDDEATGDDDGPE